MSDEERFPDSPHLEDRYWAALTTARVRMAALEAERDALAKELQSRELHHFEVEVENSELKAHVSRKVEAAPIDTDMDGAISRLRKYVNAGSIIHTASSYSTGDGVVHLIEFDDLRAVLDAAATSQPVQVEVTAEKVAPDVDA